MKLSPRLAYLIGVFVGDGSLYTSGGSPRIEISDGTSVEKELKYSTAFMKNLQTIIFNLFGKKTKLIKKQNKIVLKFRCTSFSNFLGSLGFLPGPKAKKVDIPQPIRCDPKLEKAFWIGVLDTDGMTGRKTKRVALTSISKKLCESFHAFLKKQGIHSVLFKYKPTSGYANASDAYVVHINSPFIRKFSEVLCFTHHRKKRWLLNHLKKEFYIQNKVNFEPYLIDNKIIDYSRLFTSRVFVVDGSKLLPTNDDKKAEGSSDVSITALFAILTPHEEEKQELLDRLSICRFRLGKKPCNSVKLPHKASESLKNLSKFIRITCGGVKLSQQYITTNGQNAEKIIKDTCDIFDITPKYTSKGEVLFCSGVLQEFFSKVLERPQINYNKDYWINTWSQIHDKL